MPNSTYNAFKPNRYDSRQPTLPAKVADSTLFESPLDSVSSGFQSWLLTTYGNDY